VVSDAVREGFLTGLNGVLMLAALVSFAGAVLALWLVREHEIERQPSVPERVDALFGGMGEIEVAELVPGPAAHGVFKEFHCPPEACCPQCQDGGLITRTTRRGEEM
jgi:hypothetical protein